MFEIDEVGTADAKKVFQKSLTISCKIKKKKVLKKTLVASPCKLVKIAGLTCLGHLEFAGQVFTSTQCLGFNTIIASRTPCELVKSQV